MTRKLIAVTLAMILGGCTGQQLKPEMMGATAKCLHDADARTAKGSAERQSAHNECMWAKASDMKD